MGTVHELPTQDGPQRESDLRIHAAGVGALLLDAGSTGFNPVMQLRIVAMAEKLNRKGTLRGVKETIPGVNNLMVTFDPLVLHPRDAREGLLRIWRNLRVSRRQGREVEIPVTYGAGEDNDLRVIAAETGLSVEEVIRRHSEAQYSVACIGSMAGFAYLTGLPPELAIPRRASPRMRIAVGSVIIGGVQAGVMPCDAPSGWHVLGLSGVRLFDATRNPPCWLALGDRVRFKVEGVLS